MGAVATEVNLENVPSIVRKQAEEALKMFTTAKDAAAAAGQPLGGGEPAASPAEPVVEPEGAVVPDTKPVEEPAAPAAAVVEPPAPVVAAPAPPKRFKDVATEDMTKEQRYKVLQGMHQAEAREARAARAEKDALSQEVQALREQVASLNQRQPAAVAPVEPARATQMTDEQLVEALGQDTIARLDARFERRLNELGYVRVADLKTVKDEVGQVATTVRQTVKDRFTQRMEELAPGWLETNVDPKFKEFMNAEDGYSGMTRAEAATRHLGNLDAERLARYFADFTASQTPDSPPVSKPKADKKKMTSPPVTSAAATPSATPGEVQPIKESELARFSKDVITGKYAGRDADLQAMQARIHAAQRAGKIVPG